MKNYVSLTLTRPMNVPAINSQGELTSPEKMEIPCPVKSPRRTSKKNKVREAIYRFLRLKWRFWPLG